MRVISILRSNRGFSLVELMVVVAIIGVLAAIAVPNFQRFTQKSKQAEAKSSLAALFSAINTFYANYGAYFADFRNLGYRPTGNVKYRHGFPAAGVTCPLDYVGPGVSAGGGAVDISTAVVTVCNPAVDCIEVVGPNGVALPLVPGVAPTATSFTAGAIADIDGDAAWDQWTITERKNLLNTSSDID